MKKSNGVSKKALALLLSASMLAAITCINPFVSATSNDVHTSIVDMTTNYQDDPIGVDTQGINFSWKMDSNLIGQNQTSYHIVVTKDSPDGEVVWDSGTINDDTSVGIDYDGDPLEWETRYYWSVTIVDKDGVTIKSAPSYFETGCNWEEGGANWIMIPSDKMSDGNKDIPLFRTETTLPEGQVDSARLYVSALGTYDIYINGKEVKKVNTDGSIVDDVFNPGWTDYNAYVNCSTYDVTDLINSPDIAIGAVIGRGWYKGKIARGNRFKEVIGDSSSSESALCAKLEIVYDDGSSKTIVTDETSWKASRKTPFTNDGRNCFYSGESYDSMIAHEIDGWTEPNYQPFLNEGDNSDWFPVQNSTYTGEMRATSVSAAYFDTQNNKQPIAGYKYSEINQSVENGGTSELPKGEVVEIPVDVNGTIDLKAGETLILDLGQNMVGVPNITVEAEKGTTLSLRHAEMLNDGRINETDSAGGSDGPKGSIYTANLRNAKCLDTVILNGGEETYQPSQTFHGYRYTEITADRDIIIKQYTGKVISSVTEQTGFLETSNENVNQLFSNILWGQRSNYLSVPTDCPQRDERSGWTGDAQVFSGTAVYNFNSMPFLLEYADIMNAHQEAYGSYGLVEPTGWNKVGSGYDESNKAGWSDAGIIIPWNMYLQTGDLSILENQFEQMDAYMTQVGETGGYDTDTYGDWLAFQAASVQFLNASYRAYTAQIMSKISTLLQKQDCVEKYDALFEETRRAAIDKYVTTDGDLLTSTADGVTEVVTSNQSYPVVDNAQSGLLWALKLGFYDNESQRDTMIENLLKNIHNENGSMREGYAEDTLAVGFLGVNVILPVLTEIGAEDVAYKLLLQDQMPSWLYCVENGATTIWERWNAYTSENSFARKDMTSFNHYSYGAVGEWMYENMAGIASSEINPGFKQIVLQPSVDESAQLSYVNGSYNSYYGTIESNWAVDENGKLSTYHAVVPANTNAVLYLPISKEIASTYQNISGVTFIGMTEHNEKIVAEFELTAGGYEFAVVDDKLTVSLSDGYVSGGSVESADKDILNTVIEYAQTQKENEAFNNVIADVQKSFNKALDAAKSVADDPAATQDAVDTAWQNLLNEIHKLGFVKGNISSLETLVGYAEKLDLNNYVEAGQAEFKEALAAAQALIADKDNAMEDEIAEAENNLLNALLNLRLKADKSILESVIAEANGKEANAYTAESYAVLEAAVAEANDVMADENATQEEVDAAVLSVQKAMEGLVAVEGATPETPSTDNATQTGQESTTTKAAKTGDITPIAGLAILTVAGAAMLYVRKKK